MQFSLDGDIRDHLLDFLSGTTTLDRFKDWLISVTWTTQEGAGAAETALAYEVQLALADQSSGLTTESELRDALSELIHAVR